MAIRAWEKPVQSQEQEPSQLDSGGGGDSRRNSHATLKLLDAYRYKM